MRRFLGPGTLRRETRARKARWVLDWIGPDGRRRRQALSTDRRVAEQMRAKLVADRDSQLGGLDLPLRELAERHLEDLSTRASPRHVGNVRSILERALAALPEQASEVRPYDLVRYRATLTGAGASNRTANHHVSRITALLRWGAKMGLIGRSPVGELDRLPERERDQRYRRRALTESEITRFLTASQEDDRRNATRQAQGQVYRGAGLRRVPRVPQTPLWRALIEAGARWGELTLATWADVDLHGRVLTLRAANTKAGKTRRVPLLQGLVADLVRLRAFGGGSADRVFLAPGGVPWARPTTNAMRIFNRVLERAGIPRVDDQGRKLDIHALRTTCGSRMARNGVGIVQTQRLLGHSSITLTERHYTDLGVEEIRAAMSAVPATGESLKGVG